ncbi:hypothetical protein KPL37_08905 [Clostridium frigoris]|uniref:Transcriptional regulator n=1 Tax=Clostridium frigoris TaxID=205327 RepID=A0ABS6BU27_9CLOT|nr:hypothetical protein [Clostridium frigoris]MBU3159869.1 hypothetical protein [Clostridium frigoris]
MDSITEYKILSKLPTFTIEDVKQLTKTQKAAYILLNVLIEKGLIEKIRRNLYSAVNLITNKVVASKYQIACGTNDNVYISHHTALEYDGVANKIKNIVYISSNKRFRDFEFEGLYYKYILSKTSCGIITPSNDEGIRVTDMERTIIDSIKDFEKIGGLKELMNCLLKIDFLDEEKLRTYLEAYNIQMVYQKTGFLLSKYNDRLQLSRSFFDFCKGNIGKSKRYLSGDAKVGGNYDSDWRLVVPEGLFVR